MAPRTVADAAPIVLVSVATPWGPAVVAAAPDGVHALALLGDEEAVAAAVARRTARPVLALRGAPEPSAAAARFVRDEVDRYAAEGPRFDHWRVGPALVGLSEWDRRVLGAVGEIEIGTTASYGAVARWAGSPRAARAAGGAVGRNPVGLIVPCHRVIAGDGTIGGYGGSWPADREALIALKRRLLAHEGVELRDRAGLGDGTARDGSAARGGQSAAAAG
jgi:methylated-DNA-[protein]-cysteine S-methyltransferase